MAEMSGDAKEAIALYEDVLRKQRRSQHEQQVESDHRGDGDTQVDRAPARQHANVGRQRCPQPRVEERTRESAVGSARPQRPPGAEQPVG